MEKWKEKRHWPSDQVCKKNISGFLSINRQRDIFCNFPQLFTCDYHEKILHAGKVLLQISCYEPWARAWSTNHGPTERKLLNRDVSRSGVDFIHIFCQTLIVKKITYGYELSFPVRKICYGLQLHPDPDPTERKKRVWVHLKLPAPIAAVQCSAGNGSEYCTVARDPALCLCA